MCLNKRMQFLGSIYVFKNFEYYLEKKLSYAVNKIVL